MADFELKPEEKGVKKRRRRRRRSMGSAEEELALSIASRTDHSGRQREEQKEELEQRGTGGRLDDGPPWGNLQLILSLQNKDIDLQKKVGLAFNYVKSRDSGEGLEIVSISRVILFLNNWVQSMMISSEKKIRPEGNKPQPEVIGWFLDYRCWEIFRFCLEESLKLHVSLSFSRDFLRVIFCIARDALSRLNFVHPHTKDSILSKEVFEFYSIVLSCVSLVFSTHGGVSNENLDLWVLTVGVVLKLVQKIVSDKLDGGELGLFGLQLSCFVLEPFTKFLRVHPTRKNGFRDFIDKLLEPLLHLLDVLPLYIHGSSPEWISNLLTLVEEILSQGLFHPSHIDGFLSLQSMGDYVTSDDGKPKDLKVFIKSYHRHLFDKLGKILAGKNESAIGGIGELFRLFVDCVKKQKGSSEKSHLSSTVNAEIRKALFEFFVQIMDPLIQDINTYVQDELEVGPILLDVHCTLKSANKILVSFMHEKVYIRTEDTSEGYCHNFLKVIFDMFMSFSDKINQLWSSTFEFDKGTHMEVLNLIAKELTVSVQYLLEIEYEVVGNDLETLWLMMISYSALGVYLMDAPEQFLLTSEILQLGCQLVNIYSELRQVNNTIFALCKAVRHIVLPDSDVEMMNYSKFISCPNMKYYESYATSVRMLLCSQELRLAIYNAIKSIPEGQASGCIQQLKADISESLEWLKVKFWPAAGNELGKLDLSRCSKQCFDLQAELIGRGLSEIYTLILDSLTVTMGNSSLIGVSVKDLMTIIRPSMSSLVVLQPDRVQEFLFTVTGRTFDRGTGCKIDSTSTHWVFLFFFHLYMSCRSLYRQAISLVPPDTSRKMSGVMGDSLTSYSGRDWLEKTDWTDEGYFSWVVQPSASLLASIQAVSDIYFQGIVADCSPLIYVLNAMALQRLVDLNRLINAFEYLSQKNDCLVQKKLMDDAGLSLYRKQSRKWKKCVSDFRQEAAGLTNFIMGYLPLVAKERLSISTSDCATHKDISARALHENDTWDFCVGAINENSLPTAFWWIICQNIDIWCIHAAKKKLKMFLSLLIQNSIPCVKSCFDDFQKDNTTHLGLLKEVTTQKISFEHLSDTVLYEQRFVRRHIASRFLRIFDKSVLPIFSNFGEVDLNSSPNWPEVVSALDNLPNVVSVNKHFMIDYSSVAEPVSHSFNKLPMECCNGQKLFPSNSVEFTACQSLLNILCWMPKGFLSSRSFSLFATYVLNLERFVVYSLLDCRGALCSHNCFEHFKLFLSCRRVLRNLIMASCEGKIEASQSSLSSILFESEFAVLWLLKSLSAVIGVQHTFSEDNASQVKDMIFSLMDHTSYLFLILSKDQSLHAVSFLINAREPCEQPHKSAVVPEQSDLIESELCLDSSEYIDAWKTVVLIAETLREQTRNLLLSLKETIFNAKVGGCVGVLELKKLSSIISCFQGFLWGLASALDHLDVEGCNIRTKLLRRKFEPIHKVNCCIDVFADFVNYFLHVLLVEDDHLPQSSYDVQTLPMSDYNYDFFGLVESSCKGSADVTNILFEKQQHPGTVGNCSASTDKMDDTDRSDRKKRSRSENANAGSILIKVELFEQQCLKKSLLWGFLRGENPEAAFFLRQLFIATSAMLRLNLQINSTSFLSSLVPTFIGISQVLLQELANKGEVPHPFSFVWLDGVVKFLEELASHFPLTNPTLSRGVYVKLIDLHLRAIGKCISLQGKRATLASHETESSTKTLEGQKGLSESTLSHGPYCLDEFKARLRMAFKVFVKKPSELHLLSAIQALERALVGVHEGCTIIYEIQRGSSGGGKVSSIVAAAVDCLDLVLEFVTGRKRLNVVRRHIQSLVACLFNIILHLQGPSIFYGNIPNKGNADPDPGSVILMCVEVLTRISGKHALFQMDSCHVAQSLRIPAALFQKIFQLRISEAPAVLNSPRFSNTRDIEYAENMKSAVIDRQYSIDLYAACCRLLCSVLKHHKSECQQCIAILQDSVCTLFHCLEMVDVEPVVRKGYFSWEIQEGVKCACFLRRIYEEMRQQRDVFGQHCFQFLSNYIWIYSGYGPLKAGIRREIDEALRPGVYALIDACSADDLQHLHTVFGEGPCRSTLATLQHDYKLNFQYEGKV